MKRALFIFAFILLAHSCSREGQASEVKHQYQRSVFQRHNPCPSNGRTSGPCPGFVITNVLPLKCGGKDVESNMVWMNDYLAKERDKKPCSNYKGK